MQTSPAPSEPNFRGRLDQIIKLMDVAESRMERLRGRLFGEVVDNSERPLQPDHMGAMLATVSERLASLCGNLATINERLGCDPENGSPGALNAARR